MIRYEDLVNYVKQEHIRWNIDLFDLLKGFFEYYLPQPTPYGTAHQEKPKVPVSKPGEPFFTFKPPSKEFKEPENGEYTSDDLMNLFST